MGNGETITLVAYGFATEKAVRAAEIVKLRLGNVHQETQLIVRSGRNQDEREQSGIQIKLSKKPLNRNSAGYQKPKPYEDRLNCKF